MAATKTYTDRDVLNAITELTGKLTAFRWQVEQNPVPEKRRGQIVHELGQIGQEIDAVRMMVPTCEKVG